MVCGVEGVVGGRSWVGGLVGGVGVEMCDVRNCCRCSRVWMSCA